MLSQRCFSRWGWLPHGGLALANSLATALEAVGLWALMRRRLGGLPSQTVFSGGLKAIAATFVMGLAVWGWMVWNKNQTAWQISLGGILIGGLVFVLAAFVLRIPEMQKALYFVRRRLGWGI